MDVKRFRQTTKKDPNALPLARWQSRQWQFEERTVMPISCLLPCSPSAYRASRSFNRLHLETQLLAVSHRFLEVDGTPLACSARERQFKAFLVLELRVEP